jgi:hypothetical protein
MTHNTKWILGCLGLLAFFVICGIVGIVVLVRTLDTEESKREYAARESEGREFGKTMDQAGCIKEGLARSKKMTRFEVARAVANQAFVEGCLKSSRPTSGFCNDVPSFWKLQNTAWPDRQCERAGLDNMRTGCVGVFEAQISVCQNE